MKSGARYYDPLNRPLLDRGDWLALGLVLLVLTAVIAYAAGLQSCPAPMIGGCK